MSAARHRRQPPHFCRDDKPQLAIISVKAAGSSPATSDLKGTMEREGAALGFFLSLNEATREMEKEGRLGWREDRGEYSLLFLLFFKICGTVFLNRRGGGKESEVGMQGLTPRVRASCSYPLWRHNTVEAAPDVRRGRHFFALDCP